MILNKFALVFLCAFVSISSFAQKIVINEVHYNPVNSIAGDANGDGVRSASHDEFIELVNTEADSINLLGFTIHDAGGVIFTLPEIKLGSYQALVIFGGGTPVAILNVKMLTNALSLNNANNSVFIKNANGTTLDSMSYKTNDGVGVSLVRSPEFTGLFVAHNTLNSNLFSPGKTVNNLDFAKPVTGIEDNEIATNQLIINNFDVYFNNEIVNASFYDLSGKSCKTHDLIEGNIYLAYFTTKENKAFSIKLLK